MIDLKVSRELAEAVYAALYTCAALGAKAMIIPDIMRDQQMDNLTQALQNYSEAIVKEIKE